MDLRKCEKCGAAGGYGIEKYRRGFRRIARPPWYRDGKLAYPGGGYCADHASEKARELTKRVFDKQMEDGNKC